MKTPGRDTLDSIAELKRHVMQKPKKAAPEDLDILARHYWGLATATDDFREKRKHLKRSCYLAGLAFTAGADGVEQLELYRVPGHSLSVKRETEKRQTHEFLDY